MASPVISESFSDISELDKHVCETACQVMMLGNRATFHLNDTDKNTYRIGIVECVVDFIGVPKPEYFRVVA